MATEYLDYLKERESLEAGPFVFIRFEINPEEQPDCRLCYATRVGPYLSELTDEFEWNRDP